MGDNIKLNINIPLDDNGMMGRECLECKKYFKLKPGTGLPSSYCHCPYCDYEGESNTFWTEAQNEYVRSVALNHAFNEIVKPSLRKITESFKDLERKTRGGFLQFKVKTSNINYSVPIKYYAEEDLETTVTCDNCGLIFSVYGVFAQCPDCKELNAFLIYEKSLEVSQKQFDIIQNPEILEDIRENSYIFLLSSCVSVFDGLGKELKKRKPELYPDRPKNLFQNLFTLNKELNDLIKDKHSDFDFLIKMFQVRHLYEHNMGVIDEDFVKKLPHYSSSLGRKFILDSMDIKELLLKMQELGVIIKEHFKNQE